MSTKTNSKWYFTKEQVLKHYGPDVKFEVTYRRASAAFIQEMGIKLKLPQLTIATAIAYFHRFFIRHQLKDHDRYIVSTASLFLAGKVEETPRKLDDVIKVSNMIRHKKKPENTPTSPEELAEIKNQVLTSEHAILTTIAFELAVDHPYKYLLEFMKAIGGNISLCQVAWNFVNDSLRTSLCLNYPPDLISYASIYLATKFLHYHLYTEGKKQQWWEVLNIKLEVLEDISKQILDLYEPSQLPPGAQSSSSSSSSSTTNNNNNQSATTTPSNSTSNGRSSSPLPPPPPPPNDREEGTNVNTTPTSSSNRLHPGSAGKNQRYSPYGNSPYRKEKESNNNN
ncbi:hypothetical protein CYY_001300 [Polysphondylium violaceum]|uniref:Cyclin-like domain-containing protein n=1 Tax=Polysphondylium violaceum TaxID=133409 RepID=A0A8J4V816_9MYCE|nr:hypothetical protein CYY_001300 [Polysphondylium violaceum]